MSFLQLLQTAILIGLIGCSGREYVGTCKPWEVFDRNGNRYLVAAVEIDEGSVRPADRKFGPLKWRAVTLADTRDRAVMFNELRDPSNMTWRGRLVWAPIYATTGADLGGPGHAQSHADLPSPKGISLRIQERDLQKLRGARD
ncbi:MAG TPA: hypothetical protein PLD59_10680 [Tepidisphaeraceae bacterium]|nr:hypothetical protein [Tepidisphaeraceae bacterium]